MKKSGPFLILLAQTVILCCVTLFCAAPVSCRITEEGIQLIGGDYEPPVIQSFDVLDERNVKLVFSEGVTLVNSVVSEQVKNVSDSMEHSETEVPSPAIEAAAGNFAGSGELSGGGEVSGGGGRIETDVQTSEDRQTLNFTFHEACAVGRDYELFGTVADKTGNTLTFCVPFTGYNSNTPELVMTEVQIKYAKGKQDGKEVYRGEFVEFLVLKGGNLGGLELEGGMDGESKKYCFPAVEVTAGQIFVVHLRTVGEGCVDERENLDEATAAHSVPGGLDLWSENTVARYNDSADVIILRNGTSGAVLDAFMYADDKTLEWKKGPQVLAEQAAAAGVYETGELSEAALNKSTTPLKSFTRLDAGELREAVLAGEAYTYPVKNFAANWTVTTVSPGTL